MTLTLPPCPDCGVPEGIPCRDADGQPEAVPHPDRVAALARKGSTMTPPGQNDRALVVCETCGMPVRVVFDAEGEIEEVLAVCGHVKKPGVEHA